MASTGVRRVARGSAAAAVSTFVALLSHVAAGGAPPAPIGVVVPLVLSVAVCSVLAGRRLSLPRLSASVVASQALFHSLFTVGAASGVTATAAAISAPRHAHALTLVSTGDHAHTDGAGMWAAHLAAAVITIVALRRGDRALSRLREVGRVAVRRLAVDRIVRAGRIRPIAVRRQRSTASVLAPSPVHRLIGSTAHARRGPPLSPIAV